MKLYNKEITIPTQVYSKETKVPTQILVAECKDNNLINSLIAEVRLNMKLKKRMVGTNVYANTTSYESLVNSKNLLKFIEINVKAFKKFYPGFGFNIVDAWGNIYKNKKHYSRTHDHYGCTAFSAIIFLTDGPGPGTYFNTYDLLIKEKKGRFILFNSLIKHEVKPYNHKKERITIAFNCNQSTTDSNAVLNLC
tara:strand:- start:97 stop:678 length:582 start_codon:yes stop_codon:yes gene_type:complete